ncbi:guanine nucleotide exchange factor [Chytriomyces sp. MP71]|nr:guanine nucleotide exchange factor [Chytriomyces sp. MP71]
MLVSSLALTSLKILGREIEGSEALMSSSGIQMLMTHAGLFQNKFNASSISIEAMKCLVNCLHVNEACRDLFVEMKGIDVTLRFLENDDLSRDALFLGTRFLFLLSGHSARYAADMAKIQGLGEFLVKLVTPFTNHLIAQQPISPGMGNEMSISDEILKVVFNITMIREEGAGGFAGMLGSAKQTDEDKLKKRQEEYDKKVKGIAGFENVLPILVDLITCIPVNEKDPLSPPQSFAINCLLNYPADPHFFLQWLPGPNKDKIPSVLCQILSLSLSLAMPFNPDPAIGLEVRSEPPRAGEPDYSKRKADEVIPPVILVLKELANCHENIRKELRAQLTPEDIDRTKKLDATDTTVARLIKSMSSISLENVKNSVGELLFALFNENASDLTAYIGYGNAAGFLFQRGIMSDPNGGGSRVSEVANESVESYEIYDGPKPQGADSKSKDKAKVKPHINPITGEIMSDEKKANEEWDRLSDAEKEYETHKLMEMLDKLNKSGFIKAVHKDQMSGESTGGGNGH